MRAAGNITGRSESEPMITPTSGYWCEKPLPCAGVSGAYIVSSSSVLPDGSAFNSGRRRERTSESELPTMVTCPILRPLRHSDLPYKWTAQPSVLIHSDAKFVTSAMLDEAPMIFSIAAEDTFSDVEPSGSESMARR